MQRFLSTEQKRTDLETELRIREEEGRKARKAFRDTMVEMTTSSNTAFATVMEAFARDVAVAFKE